MTIGQKIYELRNKKNMTQEELAEQMGVSRQSVSKWESDTSVPDLQKLKSLSELFGVSLDELINPDRQSEQCGEGDGTDFCNSDSVKQDRNLEIAIEELQKKVKDLRSASIILSVTVLVLAITLIINSVGHISLSRGIDEAKNMAMNTGSVTYYPADDSSAASGLQDWSAQIQSMDAESGTAQVYFMVVPDSVSTEADVSLTLIGSQNGDVIIPLDELDGSKYSTVKEIPIDDYNKIMVVIEDNGERKTEILDDYESCLQIRHMLAASFYVELDNPKVSTKNDRHTMSSAIRIYKDSYCNILDEALELEDVTVQIIAYGDDTNDGDVLWEKTLTDVELSQLANGESVENQAEFKDAESDKPIVAVRLISKNKYLEEPQTYALDIIQSEQNYLMDPTLYME